ncbi:putative reverse transcriptase domain-containing protein [Tanacetum coccineum]
MIVAEPTRLQDAIRIANNLMDHKLKGYAAKSVKNKRRYMVRDCKDVVATTSQGAPEPNQKTRNKIIEATGRAYALEGGANPDSNVVTGTFLLNNRYASILFDSGADRSFVSTTFSALVDVIPSTLDVSYVVELADERVVETNTVLRGCTLGLLGHLFNIDLMPVELGSFDVIIGMDWLVNYHAVIVCDEKIVRIPLDFLELPPTRQVEFQIDLVPGAAPITRTLYRLAPLELQELSTQLQELSDKGFYKNQFPTLGAPSCRTKRKKRNNFGMCFSKIAKPMAKLTQKSMKFNWGEKEEAAFQLLKQKSSSLRFGFTRSVRSQNVETLFVRHELVSDYDCKIRYHPVKANVVADALSQKEQIKPLRVRALVMTIGLNLPVKNLNAQVEARKEENYETKDLCGMIKKLELRADGTLCLKNRSLNPLFGDLRL